MYRLLSSRLHLNNHLYCRKPANITLETTTLVTMIIRPFHETPSVNRVKHLKSGAQSRQRKSEGKTVRIQNLNFFNFCTLIKKLYPFFSLTEQRSGDILWETKSWRCY